MSKWNDMPSPEDRSIELVEDPRWPSAPPYYHDAQAALPPDAWGPAAPPYYHDAPFEDTPYYHDVPQRNCGALRCGCSLLLWIGSVLIVAVLLPQYVDIPRLQTRAKQLYDEHILGIRIRIAPVEPTVVSIGPGEMDALELATVLRHNFLGDSLDVILTDRSYHLVEPDELALFLEEDGTEARVYYVERNDCDDYATILLGNVRQYEYTHNYNRSWAFGMAFGPLKSDASQHHAFNVVVDSNKQVHLLEPQTDAVYPPNEYEYLVDLVMM